MDQSGPHMAAKPQPLSQSRAHHLAQLPKHFRIAGSSGILLGYHFSLQPKPPSQVDCCHCSYRPVVTCAGLCLELCAQVSFHDDAEEVEVEGHEEGLDLAGPDLGISIFGFLQALEPLI